MSSTKTTDREMKPGRIVAMAGGLLVAMLLAVALPASAQVWIVTLVNEASFESRYQPIIDPDDATKIKLMTNSANWISLPRAAVRLVEAVSESEGFGRRLDGATVELGFLRNDAPTEDESSGAAADPSAALLQYFQQQDSRPAYTVEQFVEPEAASGIPVNWTRFNTPPLGGGGNR